MNNKDKYRKSGDMSDYLRGAEQRNPYHWGNSTPPNPWDYLHPSQHKKNDPDLMKVKQQIDNLEEWEKFCEEKPALSQLLEAMFGEGAIYVFKRCGPVTESRAMRMLAELTIQTEESASRLEKAIMTESIS